MFITDIKVEGINELHHAIIHNMFKFLLSALMILHVFWALKISALIYGVLFNGKYEDNVASNIQISS